MCVLHQEKYQTCVNCTYKLYNGFCVENCSEEKNFKKCKSEFFLDGTECLNICEEGKVSMFEECVGYQSEKLKFEGNLKEYLECFSPYISYKGECIERKKYMRKL